MPVTVPCPSCGAKLRIPDTAVGKKVKCSKCATAFTAAPPEEEAEAAAVQAAAPPPPRKRAPPPAEETVDRLDEADDDEPEERDDEEPEDEDEDDRPRRRRSRRRAAGDGGISTLIPYKNGRALAAYYCGVFSLIPCVGHVLGPIALILGVLGLRFGDAHPTAGGKGHAIAGIVLGLITTIGYWGLTLLFVIMFIVAANTK